MFYYNKSETEKRKILIILLSAKTRCFKNCKSLLCIYKFNKKARITQIIFIKVYIFWQTNKKKKEEKIFLLIDNRTLYNEPPKLDNIRVKYFPPNCTAILQPFGQGIITAVKSRYRAFLLRTILCDLKKNIQNRFNVKVAMEWICGAWDDIN